MRRFDDATNKYTLTFNVDEGQRYDFGPVNVEVDRRWRRCPSSCRALCEPREGEVYNAKEVQKSIEAISDQVASAGYPFARVTPRGNRDLTNNTIGVEYLVDQGERAYVERIEIRGNSRTRDYVIRREFDMSEGDAFNQQMITEAKRRLEALGYFRRSTSPPSRAARRTASWSSSMSRISRPVRSVSAPVMRPAATASARSLDRRKELPRPRSVYPRVGRWRCRKTRAPTASRFTEPYFLGYRLAAGFDLFNRSETSSNDNYDYEETRRRRCVSRRRSPKIWRRRSATTTSR